MPRKPRNSSPSSPEEASRSRYASLLPQSPGGRASLQECHPDRLGSAIDSVIDNGDLLSFSRTSDGGAICVYIRSSQGESKVYCADQATLDNVVDLLEALPTV